MEYTLLVYPHKNLQFPFPNSVFTIHRYLWAIILSLGIAEPNPTYCKKTMATHYENYMLITRQCTTSTQSPTESMGWGLNPLAPKKEIPLPNFRQAPITSYQAMIMTRITTWTHWLPIFVSIFRWIFWDGVFRPLGMTPHKYLRHPSTLSLIFTMISKISIFHIKLLSLGFIVEYCLYQKQRNCDSGKENEHIRNKSHCILGCL